MIKKERLEELIEQGATIYSTDTKLYGLVKWLELENKLEKLEFNKDGEVKLFIIDNGWWHWFNLNDLYEDLEDVKWLKEFGRIERTERLELPTWEEFIEMEEVCFWKKNHRQTVIRILGTKYIAVETSYERFFTGDLTKENYIKACRKCKELFLGEKE